MKYFYLYIFIIVCILFAVSYYNTMTSSYREFFNAEKQTFILLGDSILKNDAYVSNGKSVANLVAERNQNIYCFAEDDSKIVDVYSQIDKIPHEFDSPNTLIFLSAGGNDILSHYVDQNQDIKNTSVLIPMFSAYKNLIKSIDTESANDCSMMGLNRQLSIYNSEVTEASKSSEKSDITIISYPNLS